MLPEETVDPAGARWVEVRALGSAGRWHEVLPAGSWQPGEAVAVAIETEGRYLLCFGGDGIATRCATQQLAPGDSFELVEESGVDVVGRFVLGREAVGARISVAPVGLQVPGIFLLPLDRSKARPGERDPFVRHVESVGEGQFLLPRLAPGEYLLEARLVTGQVVRERIDIPVPEESKEEDSSSEMRQEGQGEEFLEARSDRKPETARVHDLGDLWVDPGLVMDFLVTDVAGQPVEGAMVVASQGDPGTGIEEFGAPTGSDGMSRLAGLAPDRATRITCRAEGYEPWRQRHEVPPPWVECILHPFARLAGTVLDEDEGPVAGATITLRHASEGFRRAVSDGDGRYVFEQLPSGEYQRMATAPGHGVEKAELTLGEGERASREIVLPPGQGLELNVVDAESGEPVSGVVVRVVDPPGGDRGVSDEEGELSLVVDSVEPVALEASAVGYPRHALRITPDELAEGADAPRRIELTVGGRIRAMVYDSSSGAPCAGCRITIGSDSLVTNAEGVALSGPLQPGLHIVQRPGVETRGTMTVVHGGAEILQVEVRAHQTTEVVLGEPSAEIRIVFVPSPPTGWDLQVRGLRSSYHRPTADGEFVVPYRRGELGELWLVERAGDSPEIRVGILPPDVEGDRLDFHLPEDLLSSSF